ncbi:MAG: nucleotidyl transferase AbiEii/AbiGii toxin family protein [Thermoleophilia bacterium]
MTRRPTDVAASAFSRLKALTRSTGQDFNLTLTRFAGERFLYRLSRSQHAGSFMLKGATLFVVWEEEPHRPTRDIDLLGFGEDSAKRLREVFSEVCEEPVEDDGVEFLAESVTVSDIREGQTYQGKRVQVDGLLGTAKLRVQIDVGFGDAVGGRQGEAVLPTLLDSPAPRLRAYPVEAVISEKLHAMAEHGMLNSRMKDIYDVLILSQRLAFEGTALTKALRMTFERRGSQVNLASLAPLSPAFSADATAQTRWRAFLTRNRLAVIDLADACHGLRLFLIEPMVALERGETFKLRWAPGGPWTDRSGGIVTYEVED